MLSKTKFLFMFRMLRMLGGLVRENQLYFLAPFMVVLVSLSVLVYYVGPTVVITFIYAGV
jgi:hypothetical protein